MPVSCRLNISQAQEVFHAAVEKGFRFTPAEPHSYLTYHRSRPTDETGSIQFATHANDILRQLYL